MNLLGHDTKQCEEQECSWLDLKTHGLISLVSAFLKLVLVFWLSPAGLEPQLSVVPSSHFLTSLKRQCYFSLTANVKICRDDV